MRLMMQFEQMEELSKRQILVMTGKQVNNGTWKVFEVEGDRVTLEIEPKGKPAYRQTDVFDGADKFHHKSGQKIIPFVRK